jgi:hypothetical protein
MKNQFYLQVFGFLITASLSTVPEVSAQELTSSSIITHPEIAQATQEPTAITGVKLNTTEKGLEVILGASHLCNECKYL